MLSALITSTEATIDAAQEALALTMALAVADLVDLNIFGVSFRLLRFVYDAAILDHMINLSIENNIFF